MRRDRSGEPIAPWIGAGLAAGTLAVLLLAEWRRPLRRRTEPTARRLGRNAVLAGLAGLTVRSCERPLAQRLSALVQRRRLGLLPRLRLPAPLATLAACAWLDYTLYLWHVLTHRVPLLWRFHRVHHADLDLDVSTALRFHFGEMLLSVPFRLAQIASIGVSPRALSIWYALLLPEIMLHHANVRLPHRLERWLSAVVMTPRLHGIHHSTRASEVDSNWSSGLVLWDRLHGTLRRDVPQAAIRIGVPELRRPAAVTLPRILLLPLAVPPRPRLSGRRSPSTAARG